MDFFELVLFCALPQIWTTRVLDKWQSGRGINREGAEELAICLISRGNGQLNRQAAKSAKNAKVFGLGRRWTHTNLGLLITFNVKLLRNGIRRIVLSSQ